MDFDPTKPYNDLPLLPPRVELETREILKKTILVSRALAELKGTGKLIPNETILINSIILQEAKTSSEIENIVTTNDALYQAFSSRTNNIDPATKEVLRYREALWEGYRALKRNDLLTANLFINVYRTIMNVDAGIRNTPGTRLENPSTNEIVYTPPEGSDSIRDKLHNLEVYINEINTVDPLIKLAVIHYQFESIHPFSDGNGRTGRIINILYLVQQGILDLPVLYLSQYIIQNKNEYYRLLRQVTEKQQWEPWILYMLDAIESTAKYTSNKVNEIKELMDQTIESVKVKLPSVYSKELIELIFQQPYTKVKFLVDAGLAERKTAAKYLKELESIGILISKKIGAEKLYLNIRLYDLLSG
jgi:Fic family protein